MSFARTSSGIIPKGVCGFRVFRKVPVTGRVRQNLASEMKVLGDARPSFSLCVMSVSPRGSALLNKMVMLILESSTLACGRNGRIYLLACAKGSLHPVSGRSQALFSTYVQCESRVCGLGGPFDQGSPPCSLKQSHLG